MTAWGRTGRVTITRFPAGWSWVRVDGDLVGSISDIGLAKTRVDQKAFAAAYCNNTDAAVMWILRHATGNTRKRTRRIRNTWRKERPVVWQVRAHRTEPIPGLMPGGWSWTARPKGDTWPRIAGGALTPERGHRTHIRTAAHRAAEADYFEVVIS